MKVQGLHNNMTLKEYYLIELHSWHNLLFHQCLQKVRLPTKQGPVLSAVSKQGLHYLCLLVAHHRRWEVH